VTITEIVLCVTVYITVIDKAVKGEDVPVLLLNDHHAMKVYWGVKV
jgi:hypothetical protein